MITSRLRNTGFLIVLSLVTLWITACSPSQDDPPVSASCVPLTAEEEAVIAFKGTEPRFVGEYVNNHEDGVYHCRRCGKALFESTFKFDSGSGWPAFDRAIENAVNETPDADGWRTEVTCAYCGGHLGHVFSGEGFTPTDTRYCINSISMKFLPDDPAYDEEKLEFLDTRCQFAYFAGGDFRVLEFCTESIPGVIKAETGLMGGDTDNPDFFDPETSFSGHAETVRVEFDQARLSFTEIVDSVFQNHDPQVDEGRYRSVVFFVNEEQRLAAEKLISNLRDDGRQILTSVEPAEHFWMSPTTFQDFYQDQAVKPECAD